ncbi:unnamed protein product [Bemisia tabaci]|uniref:UDP-glucuronosyltransferase n=1 Tax=Bemisia tabaci TaxID=7038 RepID=A0A9P0FAE0_BEMTA|nr:unnamed protein product [Bemisia tabaci]
MIFLHFYVILILMSASLDAFKILVLYPFPSLSHQQGIMALTERLVKKGHELYVISPNAVPGLEKHDNYTYVNTSFAYAYIPDENNADEEVVNFQRHWSKWEFPKVWKAFADIPRRQLLSEAFLQFDRRVTSEQIHFDLVIAEAFFLPYACAILRNATKSAPIITMTSLMTEFMTEGALGSIEHLSFLPGYYSAYTDRMSLLQKVDNWIAHYYVTGDLFKHLDKAVSRFCREFYGPGFENIASGWRSRSSLTLIASNPMYFYPRLLGPNVIETGPLHFKPLKKLPQNLQNWLDGAEKGVIYFSLGCNMRGKSLDANILANFLKLFAELQPLGYRVLWKWEADEEIPGQSNNILAQKWIPQHSVLAHPKVKAFITQGGLQSFQEAVHYGVPLVGVPFYGDHANNVLKMVDAGIGTQLLPKNLDSYEDIKAALQAVLYDDKYTKNMKRHSAISHDFTSRAMDQALFWVEHVARHGATHLRPSTADASLFEFFCLDIISVIVFLSILFLYIVYFLCRSIIAMICQKSKAKIKSS